MEKLNQIITYLLSFKPFVLLPVILFVLALFFRMKLSEALKSALTIGIGFIGIFTIFDFFIAQIGPAVESLVKNTGLGFNVLDVGWPPLAVITWSYQLTPLLIGLIMLLNIGMLFLKVTKTVNIDIWNYWHFIFAGVIVSEITGSPLLGIGAVLLTTVIILKLADWAAASVQKFSGIGTVSISTLSAIAYYPLGVIGDWLLAKVPGLNRWNANPEKIRAKLGAFGEPMVIGLILGMLLGLGAGYDFKLLLELAFSIAAVIYILPEMCAILGRGLMPMSEQMKVYLKEKFPQTGETHIGLDCAIIIGNTSVIVTGLLMMPLALILALVLPGINFVPLGDLPNVLGAILMVVVATRGNIVRSVIIGIPIIIGNLYVASQMAVFYTDLARKFNFRFEGYQGMVTGFLDGGNLLRFWIIETFAGAWWAWLVTPAVVGMLYWTYRLSSRPPRPGGAR
jgi:PTS system galactitol-specific IIC component